MKNLILKIRNKHTGLVVVLSVKTANRLLNNYPKSYELADTTPSTPPPSRPADADTHNINA